jgi:hypothetical protein
MILCNDCGEQNAEGTVFCTRCGVFLEWEGEQVKTATGARTAETSENALSNPVGVIQRGPDAPEPFTPVAPSKTASTAPVTDKEVQNELAPLPAPDPAASRQPETVRRRAPRRAKSPVNVPTGSLICGSCGMPNQSTRRFCAKCGFSLLDAKIVGKAPWWRRLLGRERVYAAGTRLRPGGARRKVGGFARLGVVLALLAGGGILAGPQRGLVMRGVHAVQNKVSKPIQVRPVTTAASGVSGKQTAKLAFDGATNTFWAAPRAGKGATAVPYVTGTFAEPTKLVAFTIYSGVAVETPRFVAGPRAAEIEVTVTTGGSPVVKRFPLEDLPGKQDFDLEVTDARSIQIAVVRTKAPSKTIYTAITEVELYAHR